MRHSKLRRLLFLALCCDFGLFAKRLISPLTNIVTDTLHIPGGISTSFSLMFLAIAAALTPGFGCATMIGAVQSLLALAMGRIGSMGALSPIGYIVPGLVMDVVFRLTGRMATPDRIVLANAAAAIGAALTANAIVFRLSGAPLMLYACISAVSGALCGLLGSRMVPRIARAIGASTQNKEEN